MKFKTFAASILAILGLKEWQKEDGKDTLTDEQTAALKNYGFSDSFLGAFKESLANGFAGEEEPADAQGNTRQAVLQGLLSDTTARLSAAQELIGQLNQTHEADTAAIEKKNQEIASLKQRVQILTAAAEEDPGRGAQHQAGGVGFNLSDEQQLGGLAGDMFALDRAYNQRAKAALLARQGIMVAQPVASSIDYTRLKDDLGAFYRVPWQDRLQSFLRELPSLESVFPLESGYQDLATLANIWLGEFSQADNTSSDFDDVVKGGYTFDDETLRMFDVMFAHKFKNLKELEKTWIGSLNREGSQVIKWSFIEFILAETAKKLHNERELRRINGVRKNPVVGEPGSAMGAADGLYEFIRKKVDGHTDINSAQTVYQIKPFVLGDITPANIGEKIYQGTGMIPAVLRDSGQLVLYMPSKMVVWYHKYNETVYGQNMDYKADIMYVKEYPSVRIVSIPNADEHERLIWTLDGNIRLYEHVPGEMVRFNIEQQDWTLKVWANWKESVWAVAVGYKYTDRAEMGYDRQLIFCNELDRPATLFIEGEKDKNPDVSTHQSVKTVANTSLLTITDVTGAIVGVPFTIQCGSTAYGVQIVKEEKFSLISADWEPSVGDTITMMKRADGKFIELERSTAAANVIAFAADDTTPSVQGGTEFVTGTNTKATAITNLDDAEAGVVYTIYGSGSTYASTIANSGNFVLTAAMTLSEGHSIQLVKGTGNKFFEVSRA